MDEIVDPDTAGALVEPHAPEGHGVAVLVGEETGYLPNRLGGDSCAFGHHLGL